ncbi:hypothetical protein [Psychrobacillus sp. NPDC096389]|uniref:hypothetical protein n=1 Tax=Psychrobacillus sp. NPDC096389 TaxID=3364490 RepID=UPI003822DD65
MGLHNYQPTREQEKIQLVGAKTSNLKYMISDPDKVKTSIKQIVAEDFTVYNLEFDFEAGTFSFCLECNGLQNESEILQQVFQTFAVRCGPRKVGFFHYPKGRNESTSLVIK